MPLRHEEMVLHKSLSGTGDEKEGQNSIALHGTDICMYDVRQSF